MKRTKKKRKATPATDRPSVQLAALAKGRARMAAKRGSKRVRKSKLTPRVERDTVVHMAKRRRHRRSRAITRHHSAPASRGRRAARVVGGIASENKHMTGAILAAAGLGLAKKQGYEIPHVATIGEAGSLALGGYLLDKFGVYKARWLRHAVTGLACIAVYEMASTGDIPLLHSKSKTAGIEGGYDVP